LDRTETHTVIFLPGSAALSTLQGALNVAIRALSAAIEVQEALMAFERGAQHIRTSCHSDTYSQREEYLKAIMSPIEPAK
jgi:hypothetical protein